MNRFLAWVWRWIKGFAAWWTLANVTKAADLALKLAALVAVFAVLSFFKGRGDVYTWAACWAPAPRDLPFALGFHLTTAQESSIEAALRQSARQQALPLRGGEDSMRIGCSQDKVAIELLRDRKRIALLRRMYPDSREEGSLHFVPEVAVQIAADPTLPLEKLRRVLAFIEQLRTIEIFVFAANSGNGDALDVTIQPPVGFSLTLGDLARPVQFPPEFMRLVGPGVQPVVQSDPTQDLKPGERVYFLFESDSPRPPAVDPDIVPEANTTPTVNVRRQVWFAVGLFVFILLPLVIREVRKTPTGGTPPSTAGDE